ncbi:MAG: TIGR01212 family radical SAM protein [Alloprevotella sp.]
MCNFAAVKHNPAISTSQSDSLPYLSYSRYLQRHFEGKMQKISVNMGLSCPNRDGRIGSGGCAYCRNDAFSPAYCHNHQSVSGQLEEGIRFFARKYPEMRYLAYFQTFTNTYAEVAEVMKRYEEALAVDGVEGLVIGTRPDCVPDTILDALGRLATKHYVMLEYGVECTDDAVLSRVNRGHTFAQAADAIRRTAERGLQIGVHLIMGLPGHSLQAMREEATTISDLPINVVKLHQLQIVRGTPLAAQYESDTSRFDLFTAEAYAELVVDFLERLRPDIAAERFTAQCPKSLLLAPDWGLKNYEFADLVVKAFRRRGTCQGCRYGQA